METFKHSRLCRHTNNRQLRFVAVTLKPLRQTDSDERQRVTITPQKCPSTLHSWAVIRSFSFDFCFVGACRRPTMTLSIPQCPVEDEPQLSHSLDPPIRKLWAVAVCVNLFDEAAARLWLYTELLENFREMNQRCSSVLHVCCEVEEVMNAAQSKLERCPYRE